MRDPERIDEFLDEFKIVWKAHPEMRFGQIVSDIIVRAHTSLYYIEDCHFLDRMKKESEKLHE